MGLLNQIFQDWAGWALVLVTFYLPFYFRNFLGSRALLYTVWFILSLHHSVAIINAYTATIIENILKISDSIGYYQAAVLIAAGEKGWLSGLGDRAYTNALAFMYKIFGPSRFFGEELSILAFLLSCFLLIRLIRQVGIARYELLILLVFGSLPSALIFSSLTMRESWMTLFFIASVLCGIQFYKTGKIYYSVYFILSTLLMALLHRGFFIYGIFLILTVFIWAIYFHFNSIMEGARKFSTRNIIYGAIIIIMVGATAGFYFAPALLKIPTGEALLAIKNGEVLKYIEQYRNDVISRGARSSYGINLDSSSLPRFLYSSFKIFSFYMTMPLPWQVFNAKDLYAAFESILRLIFIIGAFFALRRPNGAARGEFVLLLVLYFSMALLWSMGTENYGTSIRHHTVNFWIIILLGMPGLIGLIKRERSE